MKYSKLSYAFLSACIMSALATPFVGAADASATDMVVVTASRTEELIKNTPSAVEVITQADMKRMGADTAIAALRLAQNLNLESSGMVGNEVMLRGMETRHSLILINGQKQAGEETANTTNVYTLSRLNVDHIDRIEIVRGPSSALYGSEAMGGVINIITKVPQKESIIVGASTGSKTERNYYTYHSGQQGRWSATLNAGFTKDRKINRFQDDQTYTQRGPMRILSGYQTGYARNLFGDRQNFNGDFLYQFENKNNNTLRFHVDYMKENLTTEPTDSYSDVFLTSGMVFTAQHAMTAVNKNQVQKYGNKQIGAGITYDGKTERNNYSFSASISQLKKDYTMRDERDLPSAPIRVVTPGNPPTILSFNYPELYPASDYDHAKYTVYTLEGKNTTYVNDQHSLTYGAEYRHNAYEGTRLGAQPVHGQKFLGSKSFSTYAAYVEDIWDVSNKLTIVPAIRYEHNSEFGNNVSPKLGMTYKFNENTRVKANYGLGYRAPSISEMFLNMYHNTPIGVIHVMGNPNLDPEKSRSFDISLEGERGKTFGKVSYFQSKIKNLIDTQNLSGNDYQYINRERAEIKGAEFSLGHHIGKRWTTKATYTYVDAKDEATNYRLKNRPQAVTSLQLIYDDHKSDGYTFMVWNNFTHNYAFGGAERNGRSDAQYVKSFNTLHTTITKKWNNGLSVYAGIDNILNRKVDHLYIDGRMWRLGTEWKF